MENVFEYILMVVVITYYRPNYGQRCREHLMEATGRIVSPSFPRDYPNHLDCSWTIEVREGLSMVVEMTIEEFELEDSESCSNDYLAVYDGPTTDSPVLLPPSCGSRISWPVYPSTLQSTGRTMTVVFVSNGDISAGAFLANFKQVAPREDFILAVDVTNRQILKQDRLSVVSQALPLVGLQNPVGIDFDPTVRKVYFSDVVSDIIGRINIDGTNQETIVSSLVEVPDGLAVDYVSRVIYWTDTGTDTISLARLDGKLRRVLHASNLSEPRDILVHQNQGFIYWSDWGSFPKIEKSEGDGSNRIMIVTEELGWPNGLALDDEESKLYWADAELNLIERINLDGSHRELLKAFSTNVHPFGLVVSDNGIFWTDWVTQGIDAADHRFEEEPVTLLVNGQGARLHGLVHHTSSVPSLPERDCSYGLLNSGCNELCVLTPTGTACLAARPVFENCPRDILIWTNEATLVTWKKPSTWSPSGVDVTLSSSHGDVTDMTLSPSDEMVQITYFAVDEFGNDANCTFSISVAYDDLPPTVFMCPKDVRRELLPSQNETVVFWEAPQASDNSGTVSLITQTHQSGSRFDLGVTEVVYVWQDGEGNTAECKFHITVQTDDDLPPTVSKCPKDLRRELLPSQNETVVFWEEPQASDNSGKVSLIKKTHQSGSRFDLGDTKVVYVWQDGVGNTAECKFHITVQTEAFSTPSSTGGALTTSLLIVISAIALLILLVVSVACFTLGRYVQGHYSSSGNENTQESDIYLTPMNDAKGKRGMIATSSPRYSVQRDRLPPPHHLTGIARIQGTFYHEIK